MLDAAAHDLRRLRRIAGIVAKYGYRADASLVADHEPAPGEAPVGLSGPRKFRLMLEELGPTFIKLGQVLSSRPDLVSRAYVDELKQLQSECAPLDFADISRALEEGLGQPANALFASIEPVSLATASIAQVHRAVTLSGQQVVVKVQRPRIKDEIRADVDILYRLGKLLEVVFEESALADPVAVVQEFDAGLKAELDFQIEATNILEFQRTHADRNDVVIPSVHPSLSSSTVLTLDWLDGTPFTALPPNVDKKAIAHRILREGFDEIFVDGFFHGDPHPGNILLLADGRYGILDFGLCGRLTPQMRETLIVLSLAVALRDADTAARTLYRLGAGDARIDLTSLRDDLQALFHRFLGRSIKEVDATLVLQQLLALAVKHKIRVPPQYALLGRAAATIEGIVRDFDPEIDIGKVAAPYAERLLMGRMGGDQLQGGLYRALLQFQGYSQDVPLQLAQVLNDLSAGNFGVQIRGPAVEKLASTILVATMALCFSILGGALVIGAFVLAMPWASTWTFHGVPILALAAAVAGASIFWWVAAYVFFRPRIRKLSLSSLVARIRGRPLRD